MDSEICSNPWKRKPRGNTDVYVYNMIYGAHIPICESCWNEIARSDRTW